MLYLVPATRNRPQRGLTTPRLFATYWAETSICVKAFGKGGAVRANRENVGERVVAHIAMILKFLWCTTHFACPCPGILVVWRVRVGSRAMFTYSALYKRRPGFTNGAELALVRKVIP